MECVGGGGGRSSATCYVTGTSRMYVLVIVADQWIRWKWPSVLCNRTRGRKGGAVKGVSSDVTNRCVSSLHTVYLLIYHSMSFHDIEREGAMVPRQYIASHRIVCYRIVSYRIVLYRIVSYRIIWL